MSEPANKAVKQLTSIGQENRSSQCLSYTEKAVRERGRKKSLTHIKLGGVQWVYKAGHK